MFASVYLVIFVKSIVYRDLKTNAFPTKAFMDACHALPEAPPTRVRMTGPW